MTSPAISVEGRRVYIQTPYGHPSVPSLKSLGAHWDAQTKRWWLTSAKRAEVEAAIAASAGKPQESMLDKEVMVIGKAEYKGRSYYVRWVGQCKSGEHKARLCSLDGKLDFWAAAARAGEQAENGVARMIKTYENPRSLDGIRRYVARLKEAESNGAGGKPGDDCYLGRGGEWLVRGCGECARLGHMCPSCQHDNE